jgi:superfamily II RNA helicase
MDWAIKRSQLEQTKSQLVYQTSPDSLLMSQEYVGRMHVLRALNYIDKQNMVGLKGKVACEISNQVRNRSFR